MVVQAAKELHFNRNMEALKKMQVRGQRWHNRQSQPLTPSLHPDPAPPTPPSHTAFLPSLPLAC